MKSSLCFCLALASFLAVSAPTTSASESRDRPSDSFVRPPEAKTLNDVPQKPLPRHPTTTLEKRHEASQTQVRYNTFNKAVETINQEQGTKDWVDGALVDIRNAELPNINRRRHLSSIPDTMIETGVRTMFDFVTKVFELLDSFREFSTKFVMFALQNISDVVNRVWAHYFTGQKRRIGAAPRLPAITYKPNPKYEDNPDDSNVQMFLGDENIYSDDDGSEDDYDDRSKAGSGEWSVLIWLRIVLMGIGITVVIGLMIYLATLWQQGHGDDSSSQHRRHHGHSSRKAHQQRRKSQQRHELDERAPVTKPYHNDYDDGDAGYYTDNSSRS